MSWRRSSEASPRKDPATKSRRIRLTSSAGAARNLLRHITDARADMRRVFDYCHPYLVIISDEEVKYDTQEHNYDVHASGIR
jgi:hypothetical protein